MFCCVVVYFHDLCRICMNPLARQNRDKKKYSFSFHTRKKENPSPPNRSRNYDLPITRLVGAKAIKLQGSSSDTMHQNI